ncbi:MAG TPA: T9SS type A sorting domain-containing protein [Flavobacteriales bacterium]|nr:T9SS type A sorting domain-containing protein [Flavobacteriales bacterium]
MMKHCVAFALALLPFLLSAQSVLIYQNSFITPNTAPVNSACQQDFSDMPVNTLWEGTGIGTFSGSFQQTNTVETIHITGPADIYDDPAGLNGDFCLGMLNTAFFDKLALLVDGQDLPFIHISMDMSAINTTCGGPLPMAAPSFLVEAIDAPGGLFSLTTTEVLSSDTLFGIEPNSDSFVFNWANDVGRLEIDGSTDGLVAIRFTLLTSSYAAFDDLYIEASSSETINNIAELGKGSLGLWPNPASDRVTIEGLVPGTSVDVFSLTGQREASLTAAQGSLVDVSVLAPGTYVLRAEVNGVLRSVRLVRS